ncbi:MAG: aldo/keto reductase [Acidobacteria bacterium]|nr:aldo/keto reductase [Acidobacteriota bacterium]
MENRHVGMTDIRVSQLGLGCVTFGREIDERSSFNIMTAALDYGMTLFDTAEAYGGGQAQQYRRNVLGVEDVREVSSELHSSEKIIGRWLKANGNRSRIVLQTKVSTNFTKEHVRDAIEASLERLQTDWIDLYLFHSFDDKTPLEEGVEAMTRAVEQGKVRAYGCSNFSASQFAQCLETSKRSGFQRLEVVQPPYNLVAREIESDLLPLCEQEHVGVVAYSPLAAGFLSGKYQSATTAVPKGSRFDVIPGHADIYFKDRNFEIVEKLRRKSEEMKVPMVRLAMGWVVRKEAITSVLVGATRLAHLENAMAALEMTFQDNWMEEMNDWGANENSPDDGTSLKGEYS